MATRDQFSNDCDPKYLEKLQQLIGAKQATVFSTTYCPYCTKAKNLLQKHLIDYNEIMLDEMLAQDS